MENLSAEEREALAQQLAQMAARAAQAERRFAGPGPFNNGPGGTIRKSGSSSKRRRAGCPGDAAGSIGPGQPAGA